MLQRAMRVGALGVLFLAGPAGADDTGEVFLTPREALAAMTVDQRLAVHHVETEQVRMVVLEASVTDRKGRVVHGLDQHRFRLFEDHEPQDIAFFAAESEEPISVAFLLDVSGSMGEQKRLEHARRAVHSLIEGLRPDDRFALTCFADDQILWKTEFTQDRAALFRQLSAVRPHGRTAIIDAIAVVPQLIQDRIATRKVIVLITDGTDNSSRTSVPRAIELARQVNVPVFTLAFLSVDPAWLPRSAFESRMASLEAISTATGGRVFPIYGKEQLLDALEVLRDEISSQYVIGYYPDDTAHAGEFQEIQLEVAGRGLRARTRSGYFAKP